MSRRTRRIDSEPPRFTRMVDVRHRIVDGPVAREGMLEAAESQRIREEAPQIIARALARGWATRANP